MVSVGNIAPPSAPPLLHHKWPIPFSLISKHQPHKFNFSFLPFSLSNYHSSSLSLSLSISGRNGFCLYAQNKVKDSDINGVKMEEFDNFEDDDIEFDEDDDEDEDDEFDDDEFDDDDELLVPLENMDDWLEKKPRGFGEGKMYDTSLEDKLLEEIEQSFKAQVANIEKLKREPIKSTSKVEVQKELLNASEGVPGGIRVRINNLPKKKNIHRDLKSAFEGVPGIINISPVNSGNKKTRDPVCKGLAFVDFKSLKDADRFVQMFSGQIVSFGKSGKPIRCEILKPLDSSYEELPFDGFNSISEGSFDFLDDEEDEGDDDMEGYDSEDVDFQDLVEGPDGKYALGNSEKLSDKDRIERIEMLESKMLSRASLFEKEMELVIDEPEESKAFKGESEVKNKLDQKPNQKAIKKPNENSDKKLNVKSDKKPNVKSDKKPNVKSDQKPKPTIPGSSKKLKVREKAQLADVFSRYGMKDAKALKEN